MFIHFVVFVFIAYILFCSPLCCSGILLDILFAIEGYFLAIPVRSLRPSLLGTLFTHDGGVTTHVSGVISPFDMPFQGDQSVPDVMVLRLGACVYWTLFYYE